MKLAGADLGSVTFDHGSDYEYVAGCGLGAALIGLRLPKNDGSPTTRVLTAGTPLAFHAVATDAGAFAAAGICSGVVAPIVIRGRDFGTLEIGFTTATEVSEHWIAFQAQLAEYLAIGFALIEAEDLKRSFVQSVLSEIEADRRRIARDLHDETGQLVSAMMVNLATLEHRVPDSKGAALIRTLKSLGDRLHEQIREAAQGLRGGPAGGQSIEQALRALCREQAALHGFTAKVACNGLLAPDLSLDVQAAIYRIVQEGITNAVRHGRAKTVSLIVRRADGRVRLILEDDGCGFDVATMPKAGANGLIGMQERAQLLHGSVVVESTPGFGTTVFADLPERVGRA